VVALITGGILGALALLWNWGSSGGLVRALGGITPEQLALEIPDGAVIAFDQSGGCPKGWTLLNNTVGSAIVGAAMIPANTARTYEQQTVTNGYPEKETYSDYPKKPGGFVPDKSESKENPGTLYAKDFEPYYVFNVKTGSSPTFLPLYYCKKGSR
jgi:hypothetical protein